MGLLLSGDFVLGKALVSCTLQDFLVSLFRHLERYVENLLINRAEGGKKKKLNSDQDSVQ